MATEEMIEDPNIKELCKRFLFFINKHVEDDFFEEKWNEFKKETNKPILYEARVMGTSICDSSNGKFKRFLALWSTDIKSIMSQSSCFSINEPIILKFKGYEYYVPSDLGIVYTRVLKSGE